MRTMGILIAVALCMVTSTPSGAGTFGLGANLGFSAYNPEVGPDQTVISWPGSVVGFQPGLRLSYLADSRTHEGYLDTGMLHVSGGGERARDLELSGNYQYNFSAAAKTSPYLTAGVGLFNVSLRSDFGGGESETTVLFGAGAGIRHWVSEDHGSLRFEARFDRVEEGNNIIGGAGMFSFRFGFDLWMK